MINKFLWMTRGVKIIPIETILYGIRKGECFVIARWIVSHYWTNNNGVEIRNGFLGETLNGGDDEIISISHASLWSIEKLNFNICMFWTDICIHYILQCQVICISTCFSVSSIGKRLNWKQFLENVCKLSHAPKISCDFGLFGAPFVFIFAIPKHPFSQSYIK